MPLLIVAGISPEGRTFFFGFGVLHLEAEVHVNWGLDKLFSYLGKKNLRSYALIAACFELSNVVPESTHLLCG